MSDIKDLKRIEKLMNLFKGSEFAHGIYVEAKTNDPLKPKVKGKATTVPQGPTIKQWTEHYEGKAGLGIIPINGNDECYWGALDVDGELDNNRQPLHQWDCLNKDGSVNHILLQQRIQKLNLPLVCCYSKSKSAHCFIFLAEPIPAIAMRSILEEFASKLGVGGCEIFPKQDKINREQGGFGNWLNMPYFNGTRVGILLQDDTLTEQDIDTFLEYAYNRRLTPEQYEELTGLMKSDIDKMEQILVGAPPCLQHILAAGITTGSRNSAMFNVAVYCHRRYGDSFQDEFKKIHDQYVADPLSFSELQTICDSAKKKEYQYQCKDALLKKYCNASVCMERDHGIDFSTEIKTLKSATRILTEPYIYAVELEMDAGLPMTVYVDTDTLFDQNAFRKACSIQLHKTFCPVKPNQWNQISVNLINSAVNQEPAFEMTKAGQLFKNLQLYISNRIQYNRDTLKEDEGVFHDKDTHKIYFRLDGFRTFLIRKGTITQSKSRWAVNKELLDLEIPTDEINLDTGLSVKKRIGIAEEIIKLNRTTHAVKVIPDEYIKLEQLIQTKYEDVV